MAVITQKNWAFFEENGYMIVRNVVPKENCQAVVNAIFEFLEMNPNDPDDWYREPHRPGGMVDMCHHYSQWDIRQHPRVYEMFCELVGREDLWAGIGRVNFKVPSHPNYPDWEYKGFIHWHWESREQPIPDEIDGGILCLTDTVANQGGFQCIVGMNRWLFEWLKTQPENLNPHELDLTGFEVKQVEANTGDVVFWHRYVAHGNGHNISDKPRFSQFLMMRPQQEDNEDLRQHRIHCWRNRTNLSNPPYIDPRKKEAQYDKPPELTPLGRKLVGLDKWH